MLRLVDRVLIIMVPTLLARRRTGERRAERELRWATARLIALRARRAKRPLSRRAP